MTTTAQPSGQILRALRVPAFLYLFLALVCTQVPLLNYLGYEFSFVMALAASVLAGLTMIRIAPGNRIHGATFHGAKMIFRRGVIWNLSLLSIPLLVITTNALFVPDCSFVEGIGFFALLPVVTIWFSSGLAFFCIVMFRHPRTVYFLLLFLSFLYAAGIGYFTPAIHSYNFFYGYFPGATYDELIEINSTLLLFRGITVGLGWMIVQVSLLLIEQSPALMSAGPRMRSAAAVLSAPGMRPLSAGAIVVFALLYAFRCPLGFESTASYIRTGLGNSIATKNFIIYYPDSLYSQKEVEWIAAEHEFRLEQVRSAFNLRENGRFESYIYPSAEAKRRYIGTGSTSIAKPWSGQIHIHAGALDDVLKHELVHLVAAPFGVPVIRASLYPGLTEGLAMAIEWKWGNRTLHEYAASVDRFGVMPDMERIMGSIGFATESASLSYVLAGSFSRYLIDEFGIRQFTRVYRSGDVEAVYGKTLPELVASWRLLLGSIELGEASRDAVDLYFSRPSIFRKLCPRETARRLRDAGKEFRQKHYSVSSDLYFRSYHEGGSNEALGGYLYSELRRGETAALIAAMDTIILRQEIPARMLSLFLPVGDAYWIAGEAKEAEEVFARIACADFNDRYTEAAMIRSMALADPAAGPKLRSYLLSDQPDSLRIAFLDSLLIPYPEHAVGLFLRGRLHARRADWNQCRTDLELIPSGYLGARLESSRLMTLGQAYLRLCMFGDARNSFSAAAEQYQSPGALLEVNDWLERVEWMERGSEKWEVGSGKQRRNQGDACRRLISEK